MTKKENLTFQRLQLESAMRKAITQRYERKIDPFDLLKYLFIGMFLIAFMLGFILLTALIIIHPLRLFIVCETIIFLFILRVLTR